MTDEESCVAGLIHDAFRGVTLGNGVGLKEGQGLDDYADAEKLARYRSQDEKEDWSRISVADLNSCHSSLSFFDAEGMRFHLPAYLIADLERRSAYIVFHSTYLQERALSRFDLLCDAQRRAVREFLLLRLSDRDCDLDRSAIETALAEYWNH